MTTNNELKKTNYSEPAVVFTTNLLLNLRMIPNVDPRDRGQIKEEFKHTVSLKSEQKMLTIEEDKHKSSKITEFNSKLHANRFDSDNADRDISLVLSKENDQWYKTVNNKRVPLSDANIPFVIIFNDEQRSLTLRANATCHHYLALNEESTKSTLENYLRVNGLTSIKKQLFPKKAHEIFTTIKIKLDNVVAAGELYFNNKGQLIAISLESGCFHKEDLQPEDKASIEAAIKSFPMFADTKILFTKPEFDEFKKKRELTNQESKRGLMASTLFKDTPLIKRCEPEVSEVYSRQLCR